jgi:hypothetical protein
MDSGFQQRCAAIRSNVEGKLTRYRQDPLLYSIRENDGRRRSNEVTVNKQFKLSGYPIVLSGASGGIHSTLCLSSLEIVFLMLLIIVRSSQTNATYAH